MGKGRHFRKGNFPCAFCCPGRGICTEKAGRFKYYDKPGRNKSFRRTETAPYHCKSPCGESQKSLILDDSSSALDFATDAALRRAIRRETGKMTVFLVSQRVSSVRQADKILVLDDGELAGVGTHQQLF